MNNARKGHAFALKYLVVLNLEMSSGERALLNIMSRICFASQIENYMPGKGIQWNTNILLLIDEIDLYLHPEWQRRIVRDLLSLLRRQFKGHYFQIILTSHSPIVLSDIPVENCIFLKKKSNGTVCQEERNTQTFGANIYTLYKDAFFLSDDKLAMQFSPPHHPFNCPKPQSPHTCHTKRACTFQRRHLWKKSVWGQSGSGDTEQ